MKRMTPEQAIMYLGIQHDGGLSPCPGTLTAVCSYFPKDSIHYLKPISFDGPLESVRERLIAIMQSLVGAALAPGSSPEYYMRFTVQHWLLEIIDDVEFLIDEESHLIHFRSAARQGLWDMGRNARRMKRIKSLFRSIQA
ncbi:MAG: DUF1499 domain-containing protein [Chitinophagaceae bacterium]|nr:DUF1499 domain-containing protein [Oligoflexus sp.]